MSISALFVSADRCDNSCREPEMHHVAIRYGVSLSFEAHLARITCADLTPKLHEVVVGNGLGADEAALEIRVDDGGGLRRLGPACDRPRRGFLRTGGEIGDQIE